MAKQNDLSGLALSFVNTMTGRMREETEYHAPKTHVGKVYSVKGVDAPVIVIGKQKLKRNSYRISKSVSISSLRVGDEVLMTDTSIGTQILSALLRTDDDAGDKLGGSSTDKSFVIGDGTKTVFALKHNLGTKAVSVGIWGNSTNALYYDRHDSIVATDKNTVTVTFASAPSSKQYRVVIK
jgi:hypothetical protein